MLDRAKEVVRRLRRALPDGIDIPTMCANGALDAACEAIEGLKKSR